MDTKTFSFLLLITLFACTPSSDKEPDFKQFSGDCPTVQCVGITQKGTRCKRHTARCNERCFQHEL